MILQSLLLTKDDPTAETLIEVLLQFGVVVYRAENIDTAMDKLADQRFDQVIVDFDDPPSAARLLEACRQLFGPGHNPAVTVALLQDRAQIASIPSAHFILTKPVNPEQAQNTLRAATALLKHERQQSRRVAVQAEISIRTSENSTTAAPTVEGILLDLSAGGMGVLTAKPFEPAALVQASFKLPPDGAVIVSAAEVAWSMANGQTGLRFLDLDPTLRHQMDVWLAAHSQEDRPQEPDVITQCKLTDLSLGGCYVQTESPFPRSSAVELRLRAAGIEIKAEGLVRVMHPGHGMGVEFLARTGDQQKSVANFIACLMEQPDAAPELETSPRALIANAADLNRASDPQSEADDPLLELLRTGQALDEEAFLAELHAQRTQEHVSV